MSETENKAEKGKINERYWVVRVKSALDSTTRPDESHDALIPRVPKYLLREQNNVFYHPRVASFGPYHFQTEDVLGYDIELLKSEVARKMHLKIGGGLESVIEEFKKQEAQEKIKKSYAKGFEHSSEVWAWMIVRDACFVLEVLNRFREDDDHEKCVSPFIDSILDRKRHHPLLTAIVIDMLKLENQVPFWALEEIRLRLEGSKKNAWLESALINLSPINLAHVENREYIKESHILQMLHDYIVDRQVSSSQSLCCSIILCNILKKFSIKFEIVCSPEKCIKGPFYTIAAVLLFPVFIILFLWGIIFVILVYIKDCLLQILLKIADYISNKEDKPENHIPTVNELERVGVKFKKLEGDKRGISHIKFEDSTLYLPKFEVDNRSEVILRNLIALEICSQEEEKPITRYAILMNDLVDTSNDVGSLREEDIITGKLGSDHEIAKLWNSMVTTTEMPRCDFVDQASLSINKFYKRRWKALDIVDHRHLWAKLIGSLIQIILVYCTRPWLFLSSVAGLLLLVFTLVQVICLFESCQVK